ncbi:transposase [Nodosilinea sp. LEGE 07088]|uniref:transposase n=1 Tax=Nodosilinea sp. LEGE 07088 TaxID=2777968 RepID=UPI00187F7C43|nr:transposase [Nodosilinea sp. LEGE 07088]MBE9141565.1 transposase [Nodosilinea sp. LEGE 07088]
MELSQRLEQILGELRPVFSREATFGWFVLLVWGILLNTQPAAVTSYVNALGLSEAVYQQALHWFESSAFSVHGLCQRWGQWLSQHANGYRIKGERVYVGDGIKVAKEGRKMPGVKRLHQESEDVSKPEWIRGHYFNALSILLSAGQACFAVPLILQLHDGLTTQAPPTKVKSKAKKTTLVTKMADLCTTYAERGSYVVLDAYFACAPVLNRFRRHSLHLISRVRCSTVARAPFALVTTVKGRGRPRQWGSKVKLQTLFAPIDQCHQAQVWLYGQLTTVYYQCFEFHWDSPKTPVLFVLTQLPNGKQLILLSSDLGLSGPEVIAAYGLRFKIEVTFRTLVHLLGGFAYRFWVKAMKTAPTWPTNLNLADYPESVQARILAKVEALERFINLNAIALGLLQVLALEFPTQVWSHFPRWFRTLPKHGYPSERIAQLALQRHAQGLFPNSPPTLLLSKFIAAKLDSCPSAGAPDLAA